SIRPAPRPRRRPGHPRSSSAGRSPGDSARRWPRNAGCAPRSGGGLPAAWSVSHFSLDVSRCPTTTVIRQGVTQARGYFARTWPLAVNSSKRVISPEPRPTMTINVELRPEEEQALLERAKVSGRDLAGYVHQILQEHLRTSEHDRSQAEAANG